eukprot:NODE_9181_length_1441_cov_8.144597.p1 GENE.NODE_9181_length_1441_cov_8.144597~~NODE_9181_length_1441_cov_8.144597.p1  ORF type:complete len:380 (+),score=116.12 NODE_9181_length_1441_cov_8.144597:87-1142(+)
MLLRYRGFSSIHHKMDDPTISGDGSMSTLLERAHDLKEEEDRKRAEEGEAVPQPGKAAMRLYMLNNAVPFVGFGFLDNALMIIFGEMIDQTLSVTLGFSTMTAAALGNMLADVCGCASGGAVERFADKMGMPHARLTVEQEALPNVARAGVYGQMVGVWVGCVLGCFPLFLIDSEGEKAKKRKAEILTVVQRGVSEALGVDNSTLYLVNDGPDGSKILEGTRGDGTTCTLPSYWGLAGHAFATGSTLWADDVYVDFPEVFVSAMDKATDYRTKSSITVPIMGGDGTCIAVLQLINKMQDDGTVGIFSLADMHFTEEVADFLAFAIEGEELVFKQVINILRRRRQRTAAEAY